MVVKMANGSPALVVISKTYNMRSQESGEKV